MGNYPHQHAHRTDERMIVVIVVIIIIIIMYTFLRSLGRLLVTANVVPSSSFLVTLMMEALGSLETTVLTRALRRNIPEDDILNSHRRENLKSNITLTGWTL
jgi:hypothetical protein